MIVTIRDLNFLIQYKRKHLIAHVDCELIATITGSALQVHKHRKATEALKAELIGLCIIRDLLLTDPGLVIVVEDGKIFML